MDSQQLQAVRQWYEKGTKGPEILRDFCSTRAEFNGRLQSYFNLLKKSFDESCTFSILAALGEIGNNCFDHNMGHWQDEPGCLFIREEGFSLIADRGRGIANSLMSVYSLKGSESYIQIAFSKVITGRAPERRGNGLKFAKKSVASCKARLFCVSDKESISLGDGDWSPFEKLLKPLPSNSGTLTIVDWTNHEN